MWKCTAQFADQQPTDAADLKLYTDAILAHMNVVCAFKGSGFTMGGIHISSFHNTCLSNGKNLLQ